MIAQTDALFTDSFSPIQLIEKAKMGLLKQSADELATKFSITDREMGRLLNISERTYHRYKPETRLDMLVSERLMLLNKLFKQGTDVFENIDKFNRWLHRPLQSLGDNTPISLLDTSTGFRLVEDTLTQIEYGIYA